MKNPDRKEKNFELRLPHFAQLLGTSAKEFSTECKRMISDMDFRYKILDGEKREKILLDVLKKLDSNHLSVSGSKRKNDWEKGWSENLQKFIENDHDVLALVPAYVRPERILRLNLNYITSSDPNFELNFYTVYRQYLFRRYLSDFDSIYEFGCGTGYNLLIMAQMYPQKKFYGINCLKEVKK